MLKRILGGLLAALIALGALDTAEGVAAVTAQQRTKARAAKTALTKAASLSKAKKYKEAGEALKQAQTAIAALGADAEAAELVAPLYSQLASLHGDLELEGIHLDPLPAEPKSGGVKAGAGPAAGGVSFTKQVAPMLVSKCGGCHVRGNKGDFSLATYSALMKGAAGLSVISPKNGADSQLVEVIRSGSMPKGGGKVSPEELAMLTKWIDEGAIFDGANRDANLADPNLVPTPTNNNDAAKTNVAMATGKESVHFALDIAPVLVRECLECHGEGQQLRGRFDMKLFRGILKGGDNGEAISPGKGAASLIIQKLKGTAKDGERMPKDRDPLSDSVIAQFQKWIDEGARFDGFDVNAPTRTVAAVAHAEKITPEQLTKEREELGAHNWRLILPDGGDEHEESENFVVFGNTGKESLKEVAKIAEAQGAKLQKLLKLPAGPLMKGRTNVFVFDKKYDYSEVGRMLESRELPPELRGHWAYTIVDSYICVVPPKNNEYSLSSLIGQQVAGVLVASQGHMPHWFAEGAARVLVSKIDPKDKRPAQWDSEAREALTGGVAPDGFIKASGPDNDAVAYLFVKYLMSDTGSYQKLMSAVRKQTPFEAAFTQAYGSPPAQVAASWGGRR